MIALVSFNVENERKIALGMSQHAVPMGTSGTGIEPLKHEKYLPRRLTVEEQHNYFHNIRNIFTSF